MDIENASLLRDLKDVTSQPKKRKRHVPSDSSDQKNIFDYQLLLPVHETGLDKQWYEMLNFPCHNPQRSEVFEKLVTKCSKEIEALDYAVKEGRRFIDHVYYCLGKEQHHLYAYMVITTICTRRSLVRDKIFEARDVIGNVKENVDTYVQSVDIIVSNQFDAMSQLNEKLDQLAMIPEVCKLVGYFTKFKEQIKDFCGLTLDDISLLTFAIRGTENYCCLDAEENLGHNEMEQILEEYRKSIGEVPVLRVKFEEADAKLEEEMQKFVPGFRQGVYCLLRCLRGARHSLTIMHKQLKLLYEKNVIGTGYYDMFYSDWSEACTLDSFDD